MATQAPLSTTSNLPFQAHIPVPSLQPSFLNVPTSAPFSSQLQFFDGTDYTYRPEQFLNGIKVRTIYQTCPKSTSSDQIHIWQARRMALVTTSLDSLASSWFNGLFEADTQDWSTFTLKFLKHFDCVTTQYKAQAEPQNVQLNTCEPISIYA